MNCVDCQDTGVIGADHTIVHGGDYCNCKAGQELQAEMSGCGNCGNIDTEAECPADCPDRDIELSECKLCGKYFEGPYGSSPCPECDRKGFEEAQSEAYKEMLPYLIPRRTVHGEEKKTKDEEDIPF